MSLIFIDGCDRDPVKRGWVSIAGQVDHATPGVQRFPAGGKKAYTASMSRNESAWRHTVPAPFPTEFYIGFAYYPDQLSGNSPICYISDAATGQGLLQLYHQRGADELRLTSWATGSEAEVAISTGAGVLMGNWSFIEIGVKLDPANGWIRVRTQGNDEPCINVAGKTTRGAMESASVGSITFVEYIAAHSGQEGHYFLDDIYMVSGDGTAPSGFIGDCRIETALPISDLTPNEWVPSAGSDHFAMVDDPVSDNDGTYVQTTDINKREMFGFGSILTEVPDQIHGVAVNYEVRKTNAGNTRTAAVLKSGDTTAVGTGHASLSSYVTRQHAWGRNPNGNVPWTQSTIAQIAAGFESQGTG